MEISPPLSSFTFGIIVNNFIEVIVIASPDLWGEIRLKPHKSCFSADFFVASLVQRRIQAHRRQTSLIK